jgi:IS1 family transposase
MAIQLSVEGSTKAAIARVTGVSVCTVTRWVERAAGMVRKFQDRTIRDVEPIELQIDELRGWGPSRKDRHFVFSALDIASRLWVSQLVGNRTRRNCRLLLRDLRTRCAFGERVLIVTDAFRFYRDAVGRAWSFTCVHAESTKLYRGGSVVNSDYTIVRGTQWQLDELLERSEDSKKVNTSYIERLNLFKRRSIVGLHRRSNSLPRSRESLGQSIDLLQCYYNFVRPHGALRFGKETRTPAQQAGLVTRRLSLRDIFLAFRPWARVPWLKNPKTRAEWRLACASNS